MKSDKKILFGCVLAVCCSLASVCDVGAWPWSKKKKPEAEVEQKQEKVGNKVDLSTVSAVKEAKDKYDECDREVTQRAREHQEACAEHKKSSLEVMEARQRAETAISCWTASVSDRDVAYGRWMIVREVKGDLYDAWLKACEEEQRLARIKDAALAELAERIAIDNEKQAKERETYNQYLASVSERQRAYEAWFNLSCALKA